MLKGLKSLLRGVATGKRVEVERQCEENDEFS